MHDDVRKVIKNLEFSQKPDIKPYFLHIYRIYLPPVKQKETGHRGIENFFSMAGAAFTLRARAYAPPFLSNGPAAGNHSGDAKIEIIAGLPIRQIIHHSSFNGQ